MEFEKVKKVVLRAFSVFTVALLGTQGRAQSTPTTVSISTDKPLAVGSRQNFAGANMQIMFAGEGYGDPKLQQMLAGLNLGWMRFPGGTLDDVWDWRTGQMRPEWISKFKNEKEAVYDRFTSADKILRAKGGVTVDDYAKLLGTLRTGPEGTPGSSATHTIGVVNTFTDTPQSAAALALEAEKKGLHVDVWELGNEPFYFKTFYPTGAAYLEKVKPFAMAIKEAVPTAKVAVYIQPNEAWLESMASYRGRYWDEIYWHPYPGAKDGNVAEKMAFYNAFLEQRTERWVDTDLVKLFGPDVKVEVSEFGIGEMRGGAYAAAFLAEFMMRLSADPHVTQAGMHILVGKTGNGDNAISVTDDHDDELIKAAEEGRTVDSTKLDYGFYYSPYGLEMQIIDPVIATSRALFATTVSGGATVSTGGAGKMSAVYAQAYRSAGGANHLLLTNKSGEAQTVSVVLDGKPVHAAFRTRSVGSSDPRAQNTPANHEVVKIVSATQQDALLVPPYGVMDAVWAK